MTIKNSNTKVTIYIDNVPYQVSPENNLLAGVLSNKLNLPYFCWHPAMGSVGACRQCAVTQYNDEDDTRGRMVMSCMTPVVDGMRIGLKDHASAKFREQIIAAMMTNHPHDCPVCAEGGECHLQDMTVMTGHSSRHYRGEKRTFTNQYLGELVGHEMNRCITCYRCVRFYKDYAGGKDFDVFGSRNQVYFGRQKEGALESQFSGNLVEVCPTGVFTNKLFSAHYTRKWDLQSAPSVCAHCSIGCNTSIGERYGSVRRVINRYNHDLNGYFLCDRGRYGIGTVNSSKRIKQVSGINLKIGEPIVGYFNEKNFINTIVEHKKEHFIGIGSARASFEGNRLLEFLVGKENFSLGYNNREMQLAIRHKQLLAQYPQQSLAGIENRIEHGNGEKEHDLVVIIGEIIEQTAPRLALTLKQVLRNAALDKADSIGVKHWQDAAVRTYAGDLKTPLFSIQAQPSEFDLLAKATLLLSPAQIVKCINQVTAILQNDFEIAATVVPIHKKDPTEEPRLQNASTASIDFNSNDEHEKQFLVALTKALSQAKMPLIVTGLSLKSPQLLIAIDALMACLSQQSHVHSPELTIVAPECNSVGNLHFINEQSLSVEQVIQRCVTDNEKLTSLIVLEQDLAQISADQRQQLVNACRTLIVLDHTYNELNQLADIVLPVASVSESNGHFVNFQGRLQCFTSVHIPVKPILENWYWLSLIAKHLFERTDLLFTRLSQLQSYFAELGEPWALQVLASKAQHEEPINQGVARQTHRASGRTAITANQSVHEIKTFLESSHNDNFNYSMEGASANSSAEMPYSWSPAWNSNQSILQHQHDVNGELIHQTNINLLIFTLSAFFDESEDKSVEQKLADLWPMVEDATSYSNDDIESIEKLTVIQNIPWFFVEQQASFLPEFTLMFSGNTVTISAKFAQQIGIYNNTVVKLNINEKRVFAKTKIDENIPFCTMLISLSELPFSINNVALNAKNIHIATRKEIETFEQQELKRKQLAKQEKADVLARLKKNDQTIPINFFDEFEPYTQYSNGEVNNKTKVLRNGDNHD